MTNDKQLRKASKNKYYLWVCSVDGPNSHITICLHQPQQTSALMKDVASFTLIDSVITSMDFVKGKLTPEETSEAETDLVWIGTANKKLLIYAATAPEQEKQISQMAIPSAATHILHHYDSVFVAMACGNVLLFKKDQNDCWTLKHHEIILLENSQAITSLLSINNHVYVASGRKIYVLNGNTGEVQKHFDVQHGETDVNLMAHAGIGLWISLKNSSIICLYHTETFKHLQVKNNAFQHKMGFNSKF